ncbi:MAG: hypothetical protein IJ761_07390 [Bacteroidales bacterium]|nr:hypothetical protein [Bacteroidales bacterium]
MVSCNYWDQRYTQVLQWTFLNTSNASSLIEFDSSDSRYQRYIPIVWLGYEFQPSEQFPIVFNIRTNTQHKQRLTLAAVDRLAEWGAFANDATQQAFERNRQQQQQQQRLQNQALTNQLDSIDNMRQIITQRADSISHRMMLDSIAREEEITRQEVEQTKKKMMQEELFLFSIKPAHSDYMFGLEFNFFNCYAKTISKIEIAVSPYDDHMRLQTDKFGRRTRDIRCMGPIDSGFPAQYTFDELFWDEARKIKVLQVSSIILYFTDGTHRTFNGHKRIMRHSLSK